jgi:hypothetical protein
VPESPPRSPTEVGKLVRRRRASFGYTQETVPGISSALVGQIERGTAPAEGRPLQRVAFMRALEWPEDALERLAGGVDPDALPRTVYGTARTDLGVTLSARGQVEPGIERRLALIEEAVAEHGQLLQQLAAELPEHIDRLEARISQYEADADEALGPQRLPSESRRSRSE